MVFKILPKFVLQQSPMTTALKNIFSRINSLPVKEQNAIANLLKEELAWQKSYDKSQKKLANLAAEAVGEYSKGKTSPLNLE
jgi:hypothetical protein